MGKKAPPKSPKPNTNTIVSTNPTEALLSQFDSTGDNFAIVTQGVDRHRLRVFDTHTATVRNDFAGGDGSRFTCLIWGEIPYEGSGQKVNGTSSKKKRKSTSVKVIALGLHNGEIAFYSPSHGHIIRMLSGSHTMPINDFCLSRDGKRGYSIADDNYVVEWDIENTAEVAKWKADNSRVVKLHLNRDGTKLLTAGHTVALWDISTKTVLRKFTGHASLVIALLFAPSAPICVTTAEHERFISIWDCSETPGTEEDSIAVLSLDTDVSHIDISAQKEVLAVDEGGILALWQNPTGPPGSKTSNKSPSKKKRYTSQPPDSVIKVVSSADDGETSIPIISACFVEGAIMIARGSTVRPGFERVRYVDDQTGACLEEVILTRQPTTGFLLDESAAAMANLKATQKSYDESSVTVLGQTDFILPDAPVSSNSEPTLAEQLDTLGFDEPTLVKSGPAKSKKKDKPRNIMPPVNSLQQTLIQALHSGDTGLLEVCLLHSNPEVIRNTVRRLPTSYVIPLLEQVISRFQNKPNRGETLLDWIKAVLLMHTAYLMTVPELVKKLSNFYQALETRASVLPRLLALHGRLDLVLSQINMRTQYAADITTDEAINVYVEEEDVDEMDDEEDEGDEDEEMADLVGDADVFAENGEENEIEEYEADSQVSDEDDEDEEEEEDDDDDDDEDDEG